MSHTEGEQVEAGGTQCARGQMRFCLEWGHRWGKKRKVLFKSAVGDVGRSVMNVTSPQNRSDIPPAYADK